MPSRRHLLPVELGGALRRQGQIEQLLALEATADGLGVVRWLTLATAGSHFELRTHISEDVGSADSADVSAFPSADSDDEFAEGVVVATGEELTELLDAAVALGAVLNRWANLGVISDEYLDAR